MEIGDDAQPVPGASPGLRVRELDAAREMTRRRELWSDAIDELFALDSPRRARGLQVDLTLDRRAAEDLLELTPPGLDEILAVLTIVDALTAEPPRHDLVVVDTAPTGHALRMLEMPGHARAWARALLEILVKYDRIVDAARLGRELVALSRGLGRLEQLLGDPRRSRFVAVTRAAELPIVETERLLARLRVAVSAVIVNAVTPPGCARCERAAAHEAGWIARLGGRATMLAPAVAPPPRGVPALRSWARAWEQPGTP
jgi:arsenite-transporting ATPase